MGKDFIIENLKNAGKNIKENFKSYTLDFIFIVLFISVFQTVFGQENNIVGVILTILMASSMMRDLTSTPLKHLVIQSSVLVAMAVSACLVVILNPWIALIINFIMITIILYSFTYEYASNLYFPYILSYLFMIFIGPVTLEQLPKRVLSMLAGALCIMVYQFIKGRKRVVDTTRDSLTVIIDEALVCTQCLIDGAGKPADLEEVRKNLYKLCKMVYERRKRVLCVSDANFAMIDSARGLENLILVLYEMTGPITPDRIEILKKVKEKLKEFRAFVQREVNCLKDMDFSDFAGSNSSAETEEIFRCVEYIAIHLKRMTDPKRRVEYRRTVLSFAVRLKAALNLSPVRVVYALRVAVLLSAATLIVQLLGLPHGKWLLFTIASVSLPYADDVGKKARQRFTASVIGCVIGMASYALVPSAVGRTALMMFSGYISYYFSGYTGTFACSTIGALGGAVFMNGFGWYDVGSMAVVRIVYIAVGILAAVAANRLILPFRRSAATKQLWKKYENTVKLLTVICESDDADTQLYYSLVIQSHLLEEKLLENAINENWNGIDNMLSECRALVRSAHRKNSFGTLIANNLS